MPKIILVQGGQYGSEAKGAIAGYLTTRRKVDVAVRTGATNAGHTVYHPATGKSYKMQQLPVGFVRPECELVVGAGALIDPEILDREVSMLEADGIPVKNRLLIDRRAGLHVPAHAERSKASGRHHAIGATGKGCSEALIDRIRNRNHDATLFGSSPYVHDYNVCDTEAFLNFRWNEGAQLLLEGTQGQLLDLYLGPYPYTTHKQTGPAQWMLEAGLSPSLPTEIVMVIRTFPIRVAGNSGPLPGEISWPILARDINLTRIGKGLRPLVYDGALKEFEYAVRRAAAEFATPLYSDGNDQHQWTAEERHRFKSAASEIHATAWKMLTDGAKAELSNLFEMTTVTKKLRRIAYLDRTSTEIAARQIRPSWVAITFMNYLYPEHWYERPKPTDVAPLDFLRKIEEACKASVKLLSYGPEDKHIVEV